MDPAEPFDFERDDADDLFETLKTALIEAKGIGLAAPQLGINKRVFIMGDYSEPDNIIPVFNPIVVDAVKDVVAEEGCLSFPGLFVKAKRPSVIRVRYSSVSRESTDTINFDGMTARIFLHELDHLDGYTMADRATKYHWEKARKDLKLLQRKQRRVARAEALKVRSI
tara:strand:- start:2678 stop:3181 length:504 start_codon:yes stop_codon:yes gene_type:complete